MPSYSKNRQLNDIENGQNVNCSCKYNILFTGIFVIFIDQIFNDTLAKTLAPWL